MKRNGTSTVRLCETAFMSHGPRHQGDIDPTNDRQPFYGFAAIMRRWLQGDPYLNLLGRSEVIRTICSAVGAG